jgi:hypothetical protein
MANWTLTDTSPEVLENAPQGLQVVALRYHEEHCIAISGVINMVLNK